MFDISGFIDYLEYKYDGAHVKSDAPLAVKKVLSNVNAEYKSVFGKNLVNID